MKKKLSQIEVERNMLARDRKKYPADSTYTDEEFTQLFTDNASDFVGCEYKTRIEFLRANGYEVTHENMIADLSVRSE